MKASERWSRETFCHCGLVNSAVWAVGIRFFNSTHKENLKRAALKGIILILNLGQKENGMLIKFLCVYTLLRCFSIA